jgi:hypothetical protein
MCNAKRYVLAMGSVILALAIAAPATPAAEKVHVQGKQGKLKQELFAGEATVEHNLPAISGVEAMVDEAGASASVRAMRADERATVLEESRKVKANIDLWSQRIHGKLAEVKKRLDALDLHEIDSERVFVDDFAEILDDLDGEARAIEQAWSTVRGEYGLWREALAKAPDSYRAVAAMFESKAAEHDDASLKLHYADFAAVAHKFAKRYENKSSQAAEGQLQLERQMVFVGRSRELIRDITSLLETVPATDEGVEVAIFCRRVNEYIKVFETSVKMLKGMADQLGEDEEPARPAPIPPVAA